MLSQNKITHMLNTARHCEAIARSLGADNKICDAAFVMGLLHDIGYERISDKKDISAHPEKSAEILENAGPYMKDITKAVAAHGHSDCNSFWDYVLNMADLSTDFDGQPIEPARRVENIRLMRGAESSHAQNAEKQYKALQAAAKPKPPGAAKIAGARITVQELIEELCISGSVSLTGLKENSVKAKTRQLNEALKSGNYTWRVRYSGDNVITAYTPGILSDNEKREFAEAIIDYLASKDMFVMINIWAGGFWYSDDKNHTGGAGFTQAKTAKGTLYYKTAFNGPCPCEYSNPDTLTMTFEGPLYHELNYGDWGKGAWEGLNRIGKKYGLYHEMGHAWSLAFYA